MEWWWGETLFPDGLYVMADVRCSVDCEKHTSGYSVFVRSGACVNFGGATATLLSCKPLKLEADFILDVDATPVTCCDGALVHVEITEIE